MESLIVPEAGSELGLKLPLPITTSRLVLRRLDAGDLKDLLEFRFDEEEDALRWLEKDRKMTLTSSDHTFFLGVEVLDGRKIIGCLGLQFTDRGFLEMEISVTWNKNPQYQDLDREAVDAALGFCFEDLKLHRVIARSGSNETAGCQLFEEAGMRREGEFIKHHYSDGEWFSTVWFAMLDEEYGEAAGDPAEAGPEQ